MSRKRLFASCMALLICSTITMPAIARSGRGGDEASWMLYDAGVLRGTGEVSPGGYPDLDSDGTATRSQAAIMFVRLLGKEEEALQSSLQ